MVAGSSLTPQKVLLMSLSDSTGPAVDLCGLIGLVKSYLKADLAIYSWCVKMQIEFQFL